MRQRLIFLFAWAAGCGFFPAAHAQVVALTNADSDIAFQGGFARAVGYFDASGSFEYNSGAGFATGFLNGFYTSPDLTAYALTAVNTPDADDPGAQAFVNYNFSAEIVADPGVVPAADQTVLVDISASALTQVINDVGDDETGAQAYFTVSTPDEYLQWGAGSGYHGEEAGPDPDFSFGTSLALQIDTPISLGFSVEAEATDAGAAAFAQVDPLITIDPAYSSDYSLIFSPNTSPNPSSSAPDAGATAALLGVALAALVGFRQKVGVR